MSNRLFQAVDKAPFAGKFSVKESYVNYDTASDENKAKQYLKTMGFLGLMVAGHALQSKMGFDALSTHLEDLSDKPELHEVAYTLLDTTYATVMGAVALRQAELMGKVTRKHYRWLRERKHVPEEERRPEKRPFVQKAGAVATALTFTLTAQVTEMQSMVHADARTQARECSEAFGSALDKFGGGFSLSGGNGQQIEIRSVDDAEKYCDDLYEPTSSLAGMARMAGEAVIGGAQQGIEDLRQAISLS